MEARQEVRWCQVIDILNLIQEDAWVEPIGEDTEALLIAQAQEGSEWATLFLIRQYLPLIKKNVNAPGGHDIEDAAQEALITVLETINSHDPDKSPRLAGRLSTSLAGAVKAVGRAEQSQFSVPSGTLKRYNTILRAAEGNKGVALNLCKQYKMKPATFLHIHNLINNVAEVNEVSHFPGGVPMDDTVEDSLLCEYAFTAVDEEEELAIRMGYGFQELHVDNQIVWPEGHNPLSSSLVSAAMGISTHRAKSLRSKALIKMREALMAEVSHVA